MPWTTDRVASPAAKHSGASLIHVGLEGDAETLTFVVEDDGVGFDGGSTPPGTGLANLRDRLESLGGTLSTGRAPAGGALIRGCLPATPLPAPIGEVA